MHAFLVVTLADGQESTTPSLTPAVLFFGGIGLLVVALGARWANKRLFENDSFLADSIAYGSLAGGAYCIYQALFGG